MWGPSARTPRGRCDLTCPNPPRKRYEPRSLQKEVPGWEIPSYVFPPLKDRSSDSQPQISTPQAPTRVDSVPRLPLLPRPTDQPAMLLRGTLEDPSVRLPSPRESLHP